MDKIANVKRTDTWTRLDGAGGMIRLLQYRDGNNIFSFGSEDCFVPLVPIRIGGEIDQLPEMAMATLRGWGYAVAIDGEPERLSDLSLHDLLARIRRLEDQMNCESTVEAPRYVPNESLDFNRGWLAADACWRLAVSRARVPYKEPT